MAKIQIGAAITESVRFVRHSWEVAPAAMVLVVLTAAAIQGLSVIRPEASAWLLVELPVNIMATGALYRSILASDRPGDPSLGLGPGGLQWGQVEWRVLGANLLVGLPLALLVFAVMIGAASVALAVDPTLYQAVQSGGPAAFNRLMSGPGGGAAALVILPGAALVIYLAARLSLFAIQAADNGRYDWRAAWSMTRGATGAILVTLIVIVAAEFAVDAVASLFGTVVATVTGAGDAALLGAIAGAAAGAAFSLPMSAGLVACVYRTQRAGGPG